MNPYIDISVILYLKKVFEREISLLLIFFFGYIERVDIASEEDLVTHSELT